MVTLAEMTAEMARRVGTDSGFGYKVKFNFGEEGIIFIDAKTVPHVVSNEDLPADTTIKVKYADFCKIADGSRSPAAAFMAGRLKVTGNIGASWRLGSIIGSDR